MTAYLRAASPIPSILILSACAVNTVGVNPKAPALAQNPACLAQTGSRIIGKDADCSAFGRSYSSDDIYRTGATTADEALRLMDASITVHHR